MYRIIQVEGVVVEEWTNKPIPNVLVEVLDYRLDRLGWTRTDWTGRFAFPFVPKRKVYILRFYHKNYETKQVRATVADFMRGPIIVKLKPIVTPI